MFGMIGYVQKVKQGLRDKYGFKPTGGTKQDPIFDNIPDGTYPMKINGKLDNVKVVDGKFHLCNWDEEDKKK